MRLINIQLLFILLLNLIISPIPNLNLMLSKNKESKEKYNFPIPQSKGITDLDKKIIFSCWIKYFKIHKKEFDKIFATNSKDKLLLKSKIIENFFVNPKYIKKLRENFSKQQQLKPMSNNNDKGFYDKNSFKMILFNDAIHFISDEEDSVRNTFEILDLQKIKFISEKNEEEALKYIKRVNYFKGIYDSCYLLSSVSEQEYTICFPDEIEEANFSAFIKMLRKEFTKSQNIGEDDLDDTSLKDAKSNFRKEDTVSNLLVHKDTQNKRINSSTDGYWITIQNWTQCNLACGGGKSFLQRLCVPPKGNGKPCEGQPILTRDCNTQKCPTVFNNKSSNNNIFTNPTINRKSKTFVMPAAKAISLNFSNQPLRYDKCHLKEDNLFVSEFSDRKFIIPTRVIMNEHSISAFKGDNYDSNVVSFNLKDTKIFKDQKDPNCFVLANNLNKYVFCSYFSGSSKKNAVEEWVYDFNLFKNQCSYKKEIKQNKQFEKSIAENQNINENIFIRKSDSDIMNNDGKLSLFAQLAK